MYLPGIQKEQGLSKDKNKKRGNDKKIAQKTLKEKRAEKFEKKKK